MNGIRDLTKSVISSSWRMTMFGAEQITRAITFPVTNLLATQGEPFRSVTATVAQQIDSAFQAMTRVGDDVQRRTVDLMFDFCLLKPFTDALKSTGLLGRGQGYQKQPE